MTTLEYNAERESIEQQIAKLKRRLFELDHKVPDHDVVQLPSPWPPTQSYNVACRWGMTTADMDWLIEGHCYAPDRTCLEINYMVSQRMVLDTRDRIALFEHLHKTIIRKLADIFDGEGKIE